MKKVLVLLVALMLSSVAFSQNDVKIIVTGDRVSLRAAPEADAVLLGRMMLGDELILKNNSDAEWVGVLPPETIDFWVNSEFVSNSVVATKMLNIRSGPSLSHSVVGSAWKGDVLTVRGEIDEWLKIAPTSNTVIWISRKYAEAPTVEEAVVLVSQVETAIPAQETPAVTVAEPVAPEVAAVTPPVAEPVVPEVVTVAPPVAVPVLQGLSIEPSQTAESISAMMTKLMPADGTPLSADQVKPQGAQGLYAGVLKKENQLYYKLVDAHFDDVIVCYVRGNSAQMKEFDGRNLEISGKVYWADGMDLPVMVPARIKPVATK